MPNIPSGNPSHRQMEKPLEELQTVFDQPSPTAAAMPSERSEHPLFGGSGNLEPLEFLDPPDTDTSFQVIEQGLDVLASMDTLHDIGPGGGAPQDTPRGQDDGESGAKDTVSGVVRILLASIAIGLLLLALLGESLSAPLGMGNAGRLTLQ